MKYTKEILEKYVAESTTFSEVCRKLGCKATGGSYYHIHTRIKKLGIDTSHFLTRNEIGKRNTKTLYRLYKSFDDIFKLHNIRIRALTLRHWMLKYGFIYVCSICKINKWNKLDIQLEIDHINGNPLDNNVDNLRFLCTNCHSQTSTYGNKKRNPTELVRS